MAAIVSVLYHKFCRRTHTRSHPTRQSFRRESALFLFREIVGRSHTNTTRPAFETRLETKSSAAARLTHWLRLRAKKNSARRTVSRRADLQSRTVKTRRTYLFGALARMVISVPRIMSRSLRPCA